MFFIFTFVLSWYCIHCLFSVFTCTFVTCDIKYQSINQSRRKWEEVNEDWQLRRM